MSVSTVIMEVVSREIVADNFDQLEMVSLVLVVSVNRCKVIIIMQLLH